MFKKNIILTGRPKSGKTTLIENLIASFSNKQGFLTKEILEKNDRRVGFEAVTADGIRTIIAHVNIKSPFQVGKYCVHIKALEKTLSNLFNFQNGDLLYIDEIGQIELFSNVFKDLVLKYFNSPNMFITALTSVYSDKFIQMIKKRDDIVVFELIPEKRKLVHSKIKSLLQSR